MRREAGLDERVFLRLRIEHGEVADGALHRERLGRRMIRSRLAEGRILGAAHRRGQPQPPVASEHRVVVVDARFPDPLAAPVGRRLQRVERRGVPGTEAERHAADRAPARLNVVATFFTGSRIGSVSELYSGEPIERAVGVDRGIAPVAGDQVVQVLLLVHPVAQRDDDVALHALRPRRLGKRQLALGDAIGPVAVVGERQLAQVGQLIEHLLARLTRLHASPPGVGRRRRTCRTPRESCASTPGRADGSRCSPLFFIALIQWRLRQPRGNAALAAELIGGGNLEHRVPVDRRVVVRGGGFARAPTWR